MCLAVPMKLEEMNGPRGIVAYDGVRREVRLDLLEEVHLGDWLLVHAGYAIQIMDEEAAAETLELLRELAEPDPNGEARV